MNYVETLEYLFSKLPIFTRIGAAAYKADLQNTKILCNYLENPESKFKSIHIAGTNGKGSCSHMLASVFQTAGYKTGLYTSPHLIDFRERIRINGIEIEKEQIVAFTQKLIPLIEEISPSFFEVTVAMAFKYFAEHQVDIAIIETGLGGLLDSTNVILPELSIITNISYDHTHLLGDTLNNIAHQKAGIIKHQVPVVIGETQDESAHVFRQGALIHHSDLFFADQQYDIVSSHHEEQNLNIVLLKKSEETEEQILLDLTGEYQLKNCKTVLTAIDVLRKQHWQISTEAVTEGLANVKKNTGIKGRFEQLLKHPRLIVDVAHNEAGLKEVFQQVNRLKYKRLHVVTGFVQDKAVDEVLKLFPPEAKYYFTQAAIPRAMPFEVLSEKASLAGLRGQGYDKVQDALTEALDKAHPDDLILVTGSFFILADVYSLLENKNKK
jgi:dihydrofolate synthase/folylpolyglutamate synthase